MVRKEKLEDVRHVLDGRDRNILVQDEGNLVSDLLSGIRGHEHVFGILPGQRYDRRELESAVDTVNVYTIEVNREVEDRGWVQEQVGGDVYERRAFVGSPADIIGIASYFTDKVGDLQEEGVDMDSLYVLFSGVGTLRAYIEDEKRNMRFVDTFSRYVSGNRCRAFYLDSGGDDAYTSGLLSLLDSHLEVEDASYTFRTRSPYIGPDGI